MSTLLLRNEHMHYLMKNRIEILSVYITDKEWADIHHFIINREGFMFTLLLRNKHMHHLMMIIRLCGCNRCGIFSMHVNKANKVTYPIENCYKNMKFLCSPLHCHCYIVINIYPIMHIGFFVCIILLVWLHLEFQVNFMRYINPFSQIHFHC